MSTRDVPHVSGNLDAEYLADALSRAGKPAPGADIETEQLLGGRTGATVQCVRTGGQSYVLKFVREKSWRVTGMGIEIGGEHRLWAHGIIRELEGPVFCPIIDVAYAPDDDLFWVLMDDVGDTIRDRGQFTREDSVRLFEALAVVQARHDADTIAGAPLPRVSGPTDLFRKAVLHCSGRQAQTEAWVPRMLEDFQVMGAFLPLFLETLGPSLADDYLDLAADESWVAMLDAEPPTLLHGDLRRANMAFPADAIALFDWEFCASGPAGADLQWHNLLHYWGYPPDGTPKGDDCDHLADAYVEALARETGQPVDRAAFDRGWKLGWIKVIAQLGYVLVDPLFPNGADPDTTAEVTALCRRAVQRAVDMRASLG